MKQIQPGDIILYTDKNFPIWQLIMKVFGKSNYNHAGIYEGNGYVIEATTGYPNNSRVVRTNIGTFLSGYKSVCVLRPPYESNTDRLDSLNFVRRQLGKSYDFRLDSTDDDSVYCTELVAKAIGKSGIVTPLFTFRGRDFYRPDDFRRIEKIDTIYGEPIIFWTEMVQHILAPVGFVITYTFLHSGVSSLGTLSIYCLGGLLLNILGGWIQYLGSRKKSFAKTVDISEKSIALLLKVEQ
jgi:Orthopoxvirus protein of unknown function (DUF830).